MKKIQEEITMDAIAGEKPRLPRWYNNPVFPLIPLFNHSKPNKHNTRQFSFSWLFLEMWTLDSFKFEIALVFDPEHWGLGITALLPWLRIKCCIPIPWFLEKRVYQYLHRHPEGEDIS